MLEPYKRGTIWWAKGRVEYNGRPISAYVRCSTEATSKAGAADWIRDFTESTIRRHLLGEEHVLTFADAIMQYDADPKTAGFLLPINAKIGDMQLKKITPTFIRELGREMMPHASTDTWTRQIVTPIRAVINHAHDILGPVAVSAIRVKGYTKAERLDQDKARGSTGRQKYDRGNLEWLLKFRQHAEPRVGALALFMFATGARISQAVAMHPDDVDQEAGTATIPAAKGHGARTVKLPPEVLADLKAIKPRFPRGWETKPANLRLFGYGDRGGVRKKWEKAEAKANIPHLPPHSAGRHGFGQEFRVRRKIDKRAVEHYGGWSDGQILDKHYTGAEKTDQKILRAFRTSLVQAERTTKLKLVK